MEWINRRSGNYGWKALLEKRRMSSPSLSVEPSGKTINHVLLFQTGAELFCARRGEHPEGRH